MIHSIDRRSQKMFDIDAILRSTKMTMMTDDCWRRTNGRWWLCFHLNLVLSQQTKSEEDYLKNVFCHDDGGGCNTQRITFRAEQSTKKRKVATVDQPS
jgi:hypothetical protein